MLVFVKGGKPKGTEHKPSGQGREPTTKLNHHVTPIQGIETRATAVEDERSHHCTIQLPACCNYVKT